MSEIPILSSMQSVAYLALRSFLPALCSHLQSPNAHATGGAKNHWRTLLQSLELDICDLTWMVKTNFLESGFRDYRKTITRLLHTVTYSIFCCVAFTRFEKLCSSGLAWPISLEQIRTNKINNTKTESYLKQEQNLLRPCPLPRFQNSRVPDCRVRVPGFQSSRVLGFRAPGFQRWRVSGGFQHSSVAEFQSPRAPPRISRSPGLNRVPRFQGPRVFRGSGFQSSRVPGLQGSCEALSLSAHVDVLLGLPFKRST